ncbi:hypothetical protein COTS27_01493 [Spirochaetota bacterium]|nr:hypothetical protein COTS27_01493 [Spirochaetota bacterium]
MSQIVGISNKSSYLAKKYLAKKIVLILGASLFFTVLLGTCSKNGQATAPKKEQLVTFEATLEDGHRQFHVRKCATCHGAAGLGRNTGTKNAFLKDIEKPPSFKDIYAAQPTFDVLTIASSLRDGLVNHPLSKKHRYPYLSDEELISIAFYTAYLMEIYTPTTSKEAIPTPADILNLKKTLKTDRK